MKALKIIGIILGSLIVVLVLLLGALGLIPGLATVFGSDKPRVLDGPYTDADRIESQVKFGQEVVTLEAGEDPFAHINQSGSAPVDATITAKEFAAHLALMHPLSDVQVRFNPDGTFESSGKIVKERIPGYLRNIGVSEADTIAVMAAAEKYLLGNPAYYLKGQGSITSDVPTITVERAEIGRLAVPTEWAESGLLEYVNVTLRQLTGLSVTSLEIVDGQLHFQGTTPKEAPSF